MSYSDGSFAVEANIESDAEPEYSSRDSRESTASGFLSTSEVFGLSGSSPDIHYPGSFSMNSNSNTSFSTHQDNTSQNESLPTTSSSNSSTSTSTGAGGSNDFILQESLDGNISAEIDRIRRFCENVENNLASIGLGTASTPRIVRGNRRRISTAEPVETIDLSSFDYTSHHRDARNRAPDAIIDLCSPVGSRPQPPSSAPTPQRGTAQRRRLEDPDSVIIDSPSPPKRTTANNSQQDNSYKCPVCLEAVGQRNPTSTKCGHVFCQICIESAIRSTRKCPMCNKKLTARQTFRIYL